MLQDPDQPISFISALRELESPVDAEVINLASTLGTSTRTRTRTPERDWRRERLQQYHMRRGRNDDDPDDNHRLRRVMSRLSRLDDSSSSAAYGDRVPSANNLYDWSPATEADDEELDDILDELRREQPNTHPEILRVLGRSQLDSERNRIRSISSRLSSDRPPGAGTGGDSLRSTAILQSVRRHPRFSARMSQRHGGSDSRPMSESARQMAMQRASESRHSLDRERRDMLSRADSYRRNYLDHRTSTPAVSPLLEQTVKYLSSIRHAETIDDSLNHALDAGFLSKDYFCMQYTDFLTDTTAIPPPAETSWLAPGAVLSGCQHATSVAAAVTAAYDSSVGGLPMLAPPSRPWLANSFSTPRSRSAERIPEVPPPSNPPQQDRWPVKVTIHEVDWESMTLSATMEAYNVPSHPHSLLNAQSDPAAQQYTRTSSITTYLEGEILDFSNHTLLTESFKSNAANDATYWRKLPPFASMTDDDMIKALISKRWYAEVLHNEYILMRWKERCFVKSLNRSTAPVNNVHSHLPHDTPYRLVRNPNTNELQVEITHLDAEHATFDDSGCGLTISGFYYVCLSRRDGRVQGLYFDPQSSPYQCLELGSVKGGAVGAWSFR